MLREFLKEFEGKANIGGTSAADETNASAAPPATARSSTEPPLGAFTPGGEERELLHYNGLLPGSEHEPPAAAAAMPRTAREAAGSKRVAAPARSEYRTEESAVWREAQPAHPLTCCAG